MYQRMSFEPVQVSGTAALRFVIGDNAALLNAHEIDDLIAQLGEIRRQMPPAPPPQPLRTVMYSLEVDPCWYVDKGPLVDGAVLLLRHTDFGWLCFSLPPPSLSRLEKALSVQLPMTVAMSATAN